MAKLSSYRRLFEQDFSPDDKALVEQLGISINASFEELYNALNNKLTIKENISSTIAEFSVTVDANGTPKNKTLFKLESSQTVVEGLLVINCTGVDPSVFPTSGLAVSFNRSENNIVIRNIKGLQADKPYVIKVLVI